jgi:hypothetical protein
MTARLTREELIQSLARELMSRDDKEANWNRLVIGDQSHYMQEATFCVDYICERVMA